MSSSFCKSFLFCMPHWKSGDLPRYKGNSKNQLCYFLLSPWELFASLPCLFMLNAYSQKNCIIIYKKYAMGKWTNESHLLIGNTMDKWRLKKKKCRNHFFLISTSDRDHSVNLMSIDIAKLQFKHLFLFKVMPLGMCFSFNSCAEAK